MKSASQPSGQKGQRDFKSPKNEHKVVLSTHTTIVPTPVGHSSNKNSQVPENMGHPMSERKFLKARKDNEDSEANYFPWMSGRFSQDQSDRKPPRKKVCCNCKKSRCLKLYCDCFANGEVCRDCNCVGCANTEENHEERKNTVLAILERNPQAFKLRLKQNAVQEEAVTMKAFQKPVKGCNCKKTNCLKKYCECFQAGLECTDLCKCDGCKNHSHNHGNKSGKKMQHIGSGLTGSNSKLSRDGYRMRNQYESNYHDEEEMEMKHGKERHDDYQYYHPRGHHTHGRRHHEEEEEDSQEMHYYQYDSNRKQMPPKIKITHVKNPSQDQGQRHLLRTQSNVNSTGNAGNQRITSSTAVENQYVLRTGSQQLQQQLHGAQAGHESNNQSC